MSPLILLVVLCLFLGWTHALDYNTYFPAFSPIYQDSIDIEIQSYDNAITISDDTTTYSYCGAVVANVGDINDDGKDDFAYACPSSNSPYGSVVVIFGGSPLLDTDLSLNQNTLSRSDGFVVHGGNGDYLGNTIVGNFDYNVDGVGDFLACTINEATQTYGYGQCYVIFGHPKTGSSYPFKNIYLNDTTIADVTKYWFLFTNSFTGLPWGRLGYSAASGDFDGDGNNDIVLGTANPYGDNNYVVVLYSVSGFVDGLGTYKLPLTETKAIPNTNKFFNGKIYTSSSYKSLGYTLSCGDFNNDGKADILVGSQANVTLVLWGSSTDTTTDFTFDTTTVSGQVSVITGGSTRLFGWHVSTLDFNGDGKDDMAIGAYGGTKYAYTSSNTASGAVYIIFGSSTKFPSFSVSTASYSQMAVILGDDDTMLGFGRYIASAGDINNDGYDDILVGGAGSTSNYALAYLIYGVASYSTSLLTSELSSKARGLLFYSSETAYSQDYKYTFSSAGDVNRDGIDDVAIAITNLDDIYIIFGSTSKFKMETNKPSYKPTFKPSLSEAECQYYVKNVAGVAPSTSISVVAASEFSPLYVDNMAVDSSGNIYFVESSYIRKYTKSTDSVSIVAGGGSTGLFYYTYGLSLVGTSVDLGGGYLDISLRVDSNNDLVFGCYYGIFKLSATTGMITKLVGKSVDQCATSTYDAGPTAAESICIYPTGYNLGIDASNNLYFFDYDWYVIMKYNASNMQVYTLAGTGISGDFSSFSSGVTGTSIALPYISKRSLDVSSDSKVYFTYDKTLYSYTEAGTVTQTAKTISSLTPTSRGSRVRARKLDSAGEGKIRKLDGREAGEGKTRRIYGRDAREGTNRRAVGIGASTSTNIASTSASISSSHYDFSQFSLRADDARIRFGSDGNLYVSTYGTITRVTIKESANDGLTLDADIIVGDWDNYYYSGFAASGGTNSTLSFYSYGDYSVSGFLRDVTDICYQGGLFISDNTRFIRKVKNNNFSVVVGQEEVGNDVEASGVSINKVDSMAWDSSNNYLYIADTDAYQIQRVSSTGVFENYAGIDLPDMRHASTSASYDSASRTSAIIKPESVAVDSDGLVYFFDTSLNMRTIRMITYGGTVLTIVGSRYTNNQNTTSVYSSAATSIYLSKYSDFTGLAIRGKNLYFVNLANADYNHGVYIGKYDMSADYVTKVAGGAYCTSYIDIYSTCPMAEGGTATNAYISQVDALTVDANDNVYYFDGNANILRKVTSASKISTIAGTGSPLFTSTCSVEYSTSLDNCVATSTSIFQMSALAVDVYSNVYFGSLYSTHVYKIDGSSGLISQFFADHSGWSYNGDGLSVTSTYLSGVSSLAYDGENMYVGDVYNQVIRKILCTNSYLSFDVAYNLVGVTATQYNLDSATNDLVFKLSFLSSLESEGVSGLTTNDITITEVVDVNNIMSSYVVAMLPSLRALLSSGIKITSKIVVFPSSIGFSSSNSAFSSISSAISNSYSSGAFASALSTNANSYGSVLTSATPSTVVSPSISGYISSSDDDITYPSVYSTPTYKSFAMLVGYDRDTVFEDWYSAIGVPITFGLWIIGVVIVMFNTEHSEYQSVFFAMFTVLSNLNMFFDNGNLLTSWFNDSTHLWMAILFSWLLPATYFFTLTIIKNELFPWFITDYFFGRIIAKKYRITAFWFWLSHAKGLPLIDNQKQRFSFENHDSLPKVIIYIVSWVVLIVGQLICLIPFALWIAVLSPYYITLYLVGIFLFQTKLLVHKTVWNTWCALFTNRANRYAKNVTYDTKFFNESLLCEFVLQSIPQLIIKFVNNAEIDASSSKYGPGNYISVYSTPAVSLISAIILFIRYVVLVVAYNRDILDVPFFFKFRYEGKTYKYGIKKSAFDFAANKEAREAYLEYWIQVHNNCKADLLYLGTYAVLRYVFFKPDDADNVSAVKKSREPLLLALREKDMRDVSTLELATDTISYMLKDCKDMKLYRYLMSVEVREPLDLLDISEETLNGILKCINNYKVRQIVGANLHILLLSNLIAKDSLLVRDAKGSSKHLSSKFGTNRYRQLLFPLIKIQGQVDLGVEVDEDGLRVSELGEISLEAGIALNDRVLTVNDTRVHTVEEYRAAVERSNHAVGDYHNTRNQVRILVARVNESYAGDRAASTSDDLYSVFRKSTISFHSNQKRRSIYSSLIGGGSSEVVDADAIMKMNDRELLKMFKRIDKDDSGTIEEPELQKFLEELHIGGAKTAKSMMELVDENGDGEVDKEEFLRMMHTIQGKVNAQPQDAVLDIPEAEERQALTSPSEPREYNPFKLFRQHTERILLGKHKQTNAGDGGAAAPESSQVELTVLETTNDDSSQVELTVLESTDDGTAGGLVTTNDDTTSM